MYLFNLFCKVHTCKNTCMGKKCALVVFSPKQNLSCFQPKHCDQNFILFSSVNLTNFGKFWEKIANFWITQKIEKTLMHSQCSGIKHMLTKVESGKKV